MAAVSASTPTLASPLTKLLAILALGRLRHGATPPKEASNDTFPNLPSVNVVVAAPLNDTALRLRITLSAHEPQARHRLRCQRHNRRHPATTLLQQKEAQQPPTGDLRQNIIVCQQASSGRCHHTRTDRPAKRTVIIHCSNANSRLTTMPTISLLLRLTARRLKTNFMTSSTTMMTPFRRCLPMTPTGDAPGSNLIINFHFESKVFHHLIAAHESSIQSS